MAALRIPRYAQIHKLAIVDDESSDAQIPEWEVEAAGFEPLLINAELHGDVPESRRPYRVLLRITDVAYESTEKVVDAILPGWNPRKAVRFPVSLLPPELQEKVAPDVAFFARVNIGTDNVDELYFREFELAPEPDIQVMQGYKWMSDATSIPM